jgi:hypothetical protein
LLESIRHRSAAPTADGRFARPEGFFKQFVSIWSLVWIGHGTGCLMSKTQNIYDLFGPTSLSRWERLIADGKTPTKIELADILEANREEPLPPWFIETVVKSLRGELIRRPGRPKEGALLQIRFQLAKAKYPLYHEWLKKRKRVSGLNGWPAVRKKHWWQGPPHERAARIVTGRWPNKMSWRAFLNRVSSQ